MAGLHVRPRIRAGSDGSRAAQYSDNNVVADVGTLVGADEAADRDNGVLPDSDHVRVRRELIERHGQRLGHAIDEDAGCGREDQLVADPDVLQVTEDTLRGIIGSVSIGVPRHERRLRPRDLRRGTDIDPSDLAKEGGVVTRLTGNFARGRVAVVRQPGGRGVDEDSTVSESAEGDELTTWDRFDGGRQPECWRPGSTRTSTSGSASRPAGPTCPSTRSSKLIGSGIVHSNLRLSASLLEGTASRITLET